METGDKLLRGSLTIQIAPTLTETCFATSISRDAIQQQMKHCQLAQALALTFSKLVDTQQIYGDVVQLNISMDTLQRSPAVITRIYEISSRASLFSETNLTSWRTWNQYVLPASLGPLYPTSRPLDSEYFYLLWSLRYSLASTVLSLIHIWRCRRSTLCRSRWSPYH